MIVHFLTHGRIEMASTRYRALIPARELGMLGHSVTASNEERPCDILVLSKHFDYGDHDRAHRAKEAGTRVVFDCCDDHFSTPHAAHYLRMLEVADQVIAPTPEMAEAILLATAVDGKPGRVAEVVPDPYEQPEAIARPPKPNLLWFGHQSNLDTLHAILPALDGYPLEVVTLPVRPIRRAGETRLTQWSFATMAEAFQRAGIVIIPTTIEPKKQRKSANRFVESLRQGLFVCAGPLPAYDRLSKFGYVGSITGGIEWALANPEKAMQRVKAGQAAIRKQFSPQAVARAWEKALGLPVSGRAAA